MRLTVRDVARLLRVTPPTVYQWIKEDGFPAYRIQGRYRFNRVDVLEWATAKKIAVSPELVHSPGTVSPPPLLSLAEALDAGGIHYDVPNHDKESVMRAVVARLPLPDDVDREFAAQVLLAREDLGTTAVGDGLAIPHTRNPIVFHVPRPLISLCFLEKPVDFGAYDGRPVHSLFALVTPTIGSHLALLSRLAMAIKEADFRQALIERAPREEIMARVRRAESRFPDAKGTSSQGTER